MVLDEIIAEVVRKTRRGDVIDLIHDAINETLETMSQASMPDGSPMVFECLKATGELSVVAGDYVKSLSGIDIVYITQERILIKNATDSWDLFKKSKQEYDLIYPDVTLATSSQNKPSDYAIDGNNLYIGPKCDGSYTIYLPYSKLHPRVYGNTDTILFPSRFKMAVVWGAISELYSALDNDEKSDKYARKFGGELLSQYIKERHNVKAALLTSYVDV
jgi:hypothetical protein